MRYARSAIPGIAAVIAFVTMASPTIVEAREKLTYVQGMAQCTAWCDAHNRTDASRRKCYSRCDTYWVHNASDGQQYQVEGM